MRRRRGSIFRLKLEGKCWLYMGLVLAAMAICTYLWIAWREKVLLYVQTGKIYSRVVLDEWERTALDAQASGNVGIGHALSSFPKEHSRFYWRHVRREASRRLNLPGDTFELGALEAFNNDRTVEDLERVEDQLSSLVKNLKGPREPEFLRSFLASVRRPRADAGHRMLVRALGSTKGQRRLRATLTRVGLELEERDVAKYWSIVEAHLKESVFGAARQAALQKLYRQAEREALLGTLDALEDPSKEEMLREAIQARSVRDPGDIVATIRGELDSPLTADTFGQVRSDPEETMEALLAVLAQASSRDVAEELFNRRLRAIARERLQPGQEAIAEPTEGDFAKSAQKGVFDKTRAMFTADAPFPPAREFIGQLQLFEGLDVVKAMIYALTVQENAQLRRQLTDALSEPSGWDIVQLVAGSLERQLARARKNVRSEDHRTVSTRGRRLELLSATEAFQYVLPVRVSPSCMVCHKKDGFVPGEVRGALSVTFPWKPEPEEIGLSWNRRAIAASLTVIILATLGALYVLIRAVIIGPLLHLRKTAEQIARGDLTARSDVATGDELEDFSEAFNKMVHALRTSHEALQVVNRNLDLKINELGYANLRLFEANRLKDEFMANVSHELRTPLNSIIGFSQILGEQTREELSEKQRRYIKNIATSGRHLLRVINEILDLARIESGSMTVNVGRVSVRSAVQEVVSMFPKAQEGPRIEVQVDPEASEIRSDASKLKQILFNLVGNAVKFTPDDGRVTIKVTLINDRVQIAVADTGIGISEENQKVIFEKFRQVDGSVTRKYGGTGLGLSITKELVRLLSGQIVTESEVGEGSTFIVSLPMEGPGSS